MNPNMKLKDFPYEHLEIDEIKQKLELLTEEFLQAGTKEEQFMVHQRFYEYTSHVDTMLRLCEFRHSIDTKDVYYEKENKHCDTIRPQIEYLKAEFKKKMLTSNWRGFLEEKIGKNAFASMELLAKSEDARLINLKQEENELMSRYDEKMAQVMVSFDGKEYNLSRMGKFLTDGDRKVRERAYKAYTDALMEICGEIEDIYDKLVKNRTRQALAVGEKNYITLGYWSMNRNCYDETQVKKFRDNVKKYWVPFAEKIHERRRLRLGVDKLSYIDRGIAFSYGNPAPSGTPQDILDGGRKMYTEMSKETKEFFDTLIRHEMFDVLGRPGKKNGGYMEYLPEYRLPLIFANFNGTSGDVDVVTHECGHAFQGYLAADEEIPEHQEITMDVAEIHSMSMEFFAEPWCGLFFGDKMDDYIQMHLEDAVTFIPYGCMVDEFQHIVYENPDMGVKERNRAWLALEKEYRPHMDYTGNAYYEAGRFWQKQLHIFDCPFYYIDYCFAQTGALQFKIAMDKDRADAWERYVRLCRYSAKGNFLEALRHAGLKSPFEERALADIVHSLEAD